MKPVRTLLFSTLYPSGARPNHGIFVETRLRELLKSGEVDTRVVAPVPWFPSRSPRFGDWARMASTPLREERNGIRIEHPRYFLPPKVGMNIAPWTLAWGARATVAKMIRDGFDFDLIDAHYYYPDGVAASMLARWFNKPFVVTARGTDLNLIPEHAWPRKLIVQTAQTAAGSIGVCAALMDELKKLGADASKLHVLRNGVDLERFAPEDRTVARQRLGLSPQGVLIVSVGHLVERKGHHLAIDALSHLPYVQLAIVGDGPERKRLEARAHASRVHDRVFFAGARPQDELKYWFSAADLSVLCSSREGWANVLLESMACGTPVVATNIWGTPEVVRTSVAGRLMARRDAPALCDSARELLASMPSREAVRAYAEQFSWQETTQGQLEVFRNVIARFLRTASRGAI